jgi:hypothetical protein
MIARTALRVKKLSLNLKPLVESRYYILLDSITL